MSDRPDTPLLDAVLVPEDLRKLDKSQLEQFADELRQETISAVSVTGGHLGAGLGVVELTVAIHYVFDTPRDKLVWDVGHQAYPHKIVTGRRDRIRTLRQGGGLSGFTKRSESEFDPFGAAHSSTSISAALGFAIASKLGDTPGKAIAVIGDGAMSAGMAYEAMNNAAAAGNRLIVILNDNDMSIAPPVGSLRNALARLVSSGKYLAPRRLAQKLARAMPEPLHVAARRMEEYARGLITGGTLFDELGFYYVGPVDGHDVNALVEVLENVRDADEGPMLVHVVTRKGKGYAPAENAADKYHGVVKFDVVSGVQAKATPTAPSYTSVFATALTAEMARDDKVVAITAAMPSGTGLDKVAETFPERTFDVGIAEQHAVTFAGGLACEGLRPVVAIYSTFLQRGYDQLVHDVALQNLPVLFALDRAGLVGADGATHAGNYDIAFTRCIPNMSVITPSDENECRQALYTGHVHNGPVTVRYPRGAGIGAEIQKEMVALPWGKGEMRRTSSQPSTGGRGAAHAPRIAILAFGTLLHPALKAAEALDASVANMRFVKPLDVALVKELALTHDALVTVEDGCIMGGAGSAVLEALQADGLSLPVLQLGLPDEYVEHGEPGKLMAQCGLDAAGIERSIRERFLSTVTPVAIKVA